MKQNQPICIELLNSFTDVELESFQHIINCPYFNTDKVVIRIFESLKKHILHKKRFDEEAQIFIYYKVFGVSNIEKMLRSKEKKHFNAKLSLLKKLAEQFLTIEGLQHKKANFYDLLLEQLLDKRQYRLFEKHIKQSELLAQSQKKDLSYFQFKKIIEAHKLHYSNLTASVYKKDNLPELNYIIDSEYLLLKISYYITLLTIQQITKIDFDTLFVNSIDKIISLENFETSGPIIIGKATIELLKHQEKEYFEKLLTLLKQYATEITEEDLSYSYIIAINFCVRKMREGGMQYLDLFKLYEEMDKQNLFLEGDFVPIIKIKNYVSAACRVGEFDKAKIIIEKYRPFINKSDRANVCNYNYGVVAFYQQNYNEALKYFIRADLGQDANLKAIILKCHYEMDKDYDERTMQIFRSAQKFFKDNKQLTTVRKRSYRNFIQVLTYIYKIKFNATKMPLSKAKEKLIAQDVNSDREWLNTKMQELSLALGQ